MLIFDPPPNDPDAVGAAIELKRAQGGKTTPAQWQWMTDLTKRRWAVVVVPGAIAAIRWLESWGYGR